MVAIGYTSKGEILEFKVDSKGYLECSNRDLVSIEIPEGVKTVWCSNNLLTKLTIPSNIEYLNCHTNLLTELNIPEGVKYIV